MNPNPKGASPAMGAKSGGSSKRMALENLECVRSHCAALRSQLHFSVVPSRLTARRARRDRARSFHAFSEKVDNLDDEFSIDDDDASTVKPRPELAAAAQPTSGGGGAALSKPPSSSATAESPGALSRASWPLEHTTATTQKAPFRRRESFARAPPLALSSDSLCVHPLQRRCQPRAPARCLRRAAQTQPTLLVMAKPSTSPATFQPRTAARRCVDNKSARW